jgi:ribonucleotide reductase, class II
MEIIGSNFFCNLSEIHLNQINPLDLDAQDEAFKAGALSAAVLLNHKFIDERYRKSRELDPIVGVSFTGLFDFFVNLFGLPWLKWWGAGRPLNSEYDFIPGDECDEYFNKFPKPVKDIFIDWDCNRNGFNDEDSDGALFKAIEEYYLTRWNKIAHETVWDYCDLHNLKRPNRCTVVQPAGSKSLLTGASSGWHPPKAPFFIRRITFAKDDPIALACLDYGYNIIPSQSDKDENGVLLNDPFDPRVTEWLVEIPTKTVWADIDGVENIDISKFSAAAQFDFYMQVQKHYTTHNTSSTIELRENEIDEYSKLVHNAIMNDEGYISSALLARFDALETFPRLPFEPVSKQKYSELQAEFKQRNSNNGSPDFHELVTLHLQNQHDKKDELNGVGPAGCDSDLCLMPELKASNNPAKSNKKIMFDVVD